MFTNVPTTDHFWRLLIASVLFYLGLFSYAGSALGIGFDVAGVVALLTGLFGFCGLYRLLGLNTHQSNQNS